MSDDQLAKKNLELEHLRKEADVLKEAMQPEAAASKIVQFIQSKPDPFLEHDNEWIRDRNAGCACAIM